jgi:hypothetical protein
VVVASQDSVPAGTPSLNKGASRQPLSSASRRSPQAVTQCRAGNPQCHPEAGRARSAPAPRTRLQPAKARERTSAAGRAPIRSVTKPSASVTVSQCCAGNRALKQQPETRADEHSYDVEPLCRYRETPSVDTPSLALIGQGPVVQPLARVINEAVRGLSFVILPDAAWTACQRIEHPLNPAERVCSSGQRGTDVDK